jgi:metal-dependent amidase/aminoacylase/carboxypeptidase family protein
MAPSETAVISVGSIHGGSAEASNIMPAEVELISARIVVLAQAAAAATGCSASVELDWRMHVLVNHDAETDVAIAAAGDLVGAGNVRANIKPITGGRISRSCWRSARGRSF